GRAGKTLAGRAAVRQAESPEDVEADHRPAEGAQVVVDLVHEAAIAPAAVGSAGFLAVATLSPAAVQDHLHRGIARKRPLGVLEELLPIAGDDEDLLRRLVGRLASAFGLGRPSLGEWVELGQHLERTLIEELGEENPGISATRGA